MDLKKRDFLGLAAGVGAVAGLAAAAGPAVAQARRLGPIDVNQKEFVSKNLQPSTVDWNYKPRRLNKMIELWEDGQPAYVQVAGLGAGVDPYAQGVKLARTWFDCIGVGMEHGALDFSQLREFMRGLVDGGPTPSGHRTPTVIVETPVIGLDEAYARANTWVLGQLLDCGVHGFLLCHARDPKAVQTFIQMGSRYPFPRPGINLPMRGLRGANAGYAAEIWGMNVNQYNHAAELWPLDPKGELIFGVKIEDIYGVEQADKIIALPGVGMAEWGPGDQTYWLYGLDIMSENPPSMNEVWNRPQMRQIRQTVLNACKKNNVPFLNWATDDKNSPDNVIKQIQEGAKVLMCNEETALIGREYTKRKMPV